MALTKVPLTSGVTGILPNSNTTADSANTASAIVTRDVSGNFAAGTVTAALSGNATTATTASTVTTNANLTGPITSTGNATAVASQTGTGSTFVMQASPTLTTPDIGTPSAGVASNLTGLPLTTGVTGTLPIANGGTNLTTYTAGDIVYASATNVLGKLAIGTANQVAGILGANTLPTYRSVNETNCPNYIRANPNAEVDTTGWATYADAAGVSPVDGTGGAPNTTWTRSATTTLRDTANFLWTKSAGASRQGEGVSYDFTIASADQGKPLAINFDYIIASGTFTASDGITAPANSGTTVTAGNSTVAVFIYDKDNAVLIPVSPSVITSNSTTVPNTFKGTFQTNMSTGGGSALQYRLILHTSYVTDAAMTAKFDNFFVGPQSVAYGSAIGDWSSYTPTVVGAGTVSIEAATWRRVGDSIEVMASITAGTVTATSLTVTLPTGLSIDTTKFVNSGANVTVGSGMSGSTTPLAFQVLSNSASATVFYFGKSALSVQNGNVILANSEIFRFNARVPIVGWSSTTLMSNDTDTRVVSLNATASGTVSITSAQPIVLPVVTKDSHGAYNAATGRYTVPVSGDYIVAVSGMSVTTSSAALIVYKNAAILQYGTLAYSFSGATTASGSVIVPCIAGDILDIRPGATLTLGYATGGNGFAATMSINRLSGPATIAATESVNARYYASATGISGSLATISWTTKDYDSHAAMSAGTYTVPVSGKYEVSAALLLSGTFILNNTSIMEIQKNGTVVSRQTQYAGGAITQYKSEICDIIPCIAGDTLRIQQSNSGTTPAIVSSNFDNFISIARLGN